MTHELDRDALIEMLTDIVAMAEIADETPAGPLGDAVMAAKAVLTQHKLWAADGEYDGGRRVSGL